MTKASCAAIVLALCIASGLLVPVHAATIVNTDTEARSITITEKGIRTEIEISPNVTLNLCDAGCFALFPSGLMLPLVGNEAVEIKDNDGVIVAK